MSDLWEVREQATGMDTQGNKEWPRQRLGARASLGRARNQRRPHGWSLWARGPGRCEALNAIGSYCSEQRRDLV